MKKQPIDRPKSLYFEVKFEWEWYTRYAILLSRFIGWEMVPDNLCFVWANIQYVEENNSKNKRVVPDR